MKTLTRNEFCILENGGEQTHTSGTVSINSGYLLTQKQ